MSTRDDVVLPGMAEYSKVQSFELRAFDRKTQSPRQETPVVTATAVVTEIKKNIQTPETDEFAVQTLQIPEDLTALALDSVQNDIGENSDDSSE